MEEETKKYRYFDLLAQQETILAFLMEVVSKLNTEPSITLGKLYSDFCDSCKIPQTQGHNALATPASIIFTFYSLVAILTQNRQDALKNEDLNTFLDKNKINITFHTNEQGKSLFSFIKHLRNSISHCRFVATSEHFNFKDADPNKHEINFNCDIDAQNIRQLTHALLTHYTESISSY